MTNLDHWEQRFGSSDYLFGTEPNAFLASQAHRLKPGQKAVAIADGEGRNGVWLAQQGLDVLALDYSPAALRKARALAASRGVSVRFEQADMETYVWPQAEFDVAVAIFIQFAAPALRSRIFAGVKQALKPGGLLLLQGYRAEQIAYGTGGPRQPEQFYTPAMMEAAFADWSSVEIRPHDSVISEGAGHHGMSALIDVVATK
jgi:SAM-dependent methyltransferase